MQGIWGRSACFGEPLKPASVDSLSSSFFTRVVELEHTTLQAQPHERFFLVLEIFHDERIDTSSGGPAEPHVLPFAVSAHTLQERRFKTKVLNCFAIVSKCFTLQLAVVTCPQTCEIMTCTLNDLILTCSMIPSLDISWLSELVKQ